MPELERLLAAAGGDEAQWCYPWLPRRCPAALVQLLAAALARPKGSFGPALVHLAKGSALVEAQLQASGIAIKVRGSDA